MSGTSLGAPALARVRRDGALHHRHEDDGRAPDGDDVAEGRPHQRQNDEDVTPDLAGAAGDEEKALAQFEGTPRVLMSHQQNRDEEGGEAQSIEPAAERRWR